MSIGLLEISILLFLVFVILGPRRITNLFRALGRGLRDFATEITGERKNRELGDEKPDNEPGKK